MIHASFIYNNKYIDKSNAKTMLKCPICGKSYLHDSKICKQCEDATMRSGLIKEDPSINNLLVFNNYCWLGKVEHHELWIDLPPHYAWNCDISRKMLNIIEEEPNLVDIQEFPLNDKLYSSLYFE
ncbi:MAG: hypothetical protein ACTSV5_15335 [Promethearchaeota archaeon]